MRFRNRKARNKQAFTEVIDSYIDMHSKSTSKILDMSNPGGATINPASPTFLDFFCDVENTLKDGLDNPSLLNKVIDQYIVGEDDVLTKSQANYVEQTVGSLFILRSIWPIKKYFLTIRQRRNG